MLFLAGERPYVIDLDSEEAERRASLRDATGSTVRLSACRARSASSRFPARTRRS